MKFSLIKAVLHLLLISIVSACSLVEEVIPSNKSTSNEWTAADWGGGGQYAQSPRNHRYTFQVKGQKKTVVTTIDTKVNVRLFVFDPLGQLITNNYFYVDKGTHKFELEELSDGEYTLIVATSNREDIGNYSLKFTGISSGPTKVSTKILKVDKATFGEEGSAGSIYSLKNNIYTFDVTTEKSSFDCEIQSSDTDIYFEIYSPLGELLHQNRYGTGRKVYSVMEVAKGTYTLVIGTAARDTKASYNVKIFGDVSNLKQKEADSKAFSDSWARGTSHTYSLNITEDKSPLDITLQSPDQNCSFEILDAIGRNIKYYNNYSSRYEFSLEKVNIGTYTIVLRPNGDPRDHPASIRYKLSVYGKFKDIKKL